jgi:hypothetical protein
LTDDLLPDKPQQHQKDNRAQDVVAYYFDIFVQRPIDRFLFNVQLIGFKNNLPGANTL